MANVVGEPIHDSILEQIDLRQKMHGAGYNSESVKRDPKVLNYLNNRNSWIKMASGVSILKGKGEERIKDIFNQSPDLTYSPSEISKLITTGLAKNVVLFNTIQALDNKSYISRSGYRQNNLLDTSTNKMYGGLGGNSQGLQPIGGITGIKVENLNRGSIRKATVSIKVYNKFQFGLIELLYLRLGYIMILEWGWDKYVDTINTTPGNSPNVVITDMGSTIIEEDWFTNDSYTQKTMLNKINQKRISTKGNYDGFFGKVSNFSWSVNSDASYDITIDLITLGSVIESLNVNIPSPNISSSEIQEQQEKLSTQFKDSADDKGVYQNSIINNIGSNKISQYLGKIILNFPKNNSNYFNLSDVNPSNAKQIPERDRYFVRLGRFLDQIKTFTIPQIKNGNSFPTPQLEISTGSEINKCNYVTNLIPLDSSKCIFTFKFSEEFQKATENSLNLNSFNKMEEFVVEYDSVVWGKLMNIYMNITFLQEELINNLNDKGELGLFKYLQTICNGINQSTGNTTNLEPVIKEDNIIYFLEQNPIKGYDSVDVNTKTDTAPIEIMGYDSKGLSNFVQDFTFKTNITPDLMSMISIGATAGGTSASLPFNNWNSGLKNRFEETYITLKDKEEKILTPAKTIILKFQSDLNNINNTSNPIYRGGRGYTWIYKNKTFVNIDPPGFDNQSIFSSRTKDANDEELLQEVVYRVHSEEKGINYEVERERINTEKEAKLNQSLVGEGQTFITDKNYIPRGQEYLQYICQSFGGDTGLVQKLTLWSDNLTILKIPQNEASWYNSASNSNFIVRGKNSWKTYIDNVNLNELNINEVQSSISGFIPVGLSLTFEGLSGIKIYNKLEISQRFLPTSYPNALKFIIIGTNHDISNNKWKTEISTISTSITDQKSRIQSTSSTTTPSSPLNNNQPITPKKPLPPKDKKFRIIDKRLVNGAKVDSNTYGKEQSVEWLVKEMNIYVQDVWMKFLTTLQEGYPGYTLLINATYRSFQRSIELKIINKDNATAGSSSHNYAYGLDMNVVDPNNFTFLKKERKSWVESGIPQIATNLGMRWGGDFANYVDCVHFDATPVTKASKSNAKKDNIGLPQSEWNTKNTNYV